MTDDNVINLPEPGVVLDLDAWERPKEDVKPPFVVKVGGKNVNFADPADIDWRRLASVEIAADLLRVALSREDREHLQGLNLTSAKFNALMKGYYDHYDMEERIRQAREQAKFAGI